MQANKVTFYLQTADRTRKAQVTLPRSMRVSDVVKASAHRWFMSRNIDYQVANTTTGAILLSSEELAPDRVHNGDVLMIQPFPTHGSCRVGLSPICANLANTEARGTQRVPEILGL